MGNIFKNPEDIYEALIQNVQMSQIQLVIFI